MAIEELTIEELEAGDIFNIHGGNTLYMKCYNDRDHISLLDFDVYQDWEHHCRVVGHIDSEIFIKKVRQALKE